MLYEAVCLFKFSTVAGFTRSVSIMADVQYIRGGKHQRAARVAAVEAGGVPGVQTYQSKLADHMMGLNAWKHVSPQLSQKVCELARHDMFVVVNVIVAEVVAGVARTGVVPTVHDIHTKVDAVMPSLCKVARVGTFGKHTSNVCRDVTQLTRRIQFRGTTRLSLPLKLPGCIVSRPVLEDVLLPHRALAEMYNRFPASFAERICPSSDRLLDFWTSIRKHPNVALLDHLLRDVPDWRRKCIPLKLHVDAVPVVGVGKSWSKSMDVYSVTSLVGRGTTLQMHMLIWAAMSSLMAKSDTIKSRDTKHVFWKWLCWSFNQLKNGVVAANDPMNRAQLDAGYPLFGDSGMFAVLFIVAADLDEYHKASYTPFNL